jgi:hypothetical protein
MQQLHSTLPTVAISQQECAFFIAFGERLAAAAYRTMRRESRTRLRTNS